MSWQKTEKTVRYPDTSPFFCIKPPDAVLAKAASAALPVTDVPVILEDQVIHIRIGIGKNAHSLSSFAFETLLIICARAEKISRIPAGTAYAENDMF